MTPDERMYIIDCLMHDISNAEDNVARSKAEQKRFPFDHDNNDALERYKLKESRARRALFVFQEEHPV